MKKSIEDKLFIVFQIVVMVYLAMTLVVLFFSFFAQTKPKPTPTPQEFGCPVLDGDNLNRPNWVTICTNEGKAITINVETHEIVAIDKAEDNQAQKGKERKAIILTNNR